MRWRFGILVGLSIGGIVAVGGCDTRPDTLRQRQAFGKQFELETQRRRTSLLDRTDDVSNAEGVTAPEKDKASSAVAGGWRSNSEAMALGPLAGDVTAGLWTFSEEQRVEANRKSVDVALVDANAVGADYKAAFDRGEEMMRRGDFTHALLCFDEAKAINPQSYAAYVGEAICYFNTNDFGKALAAIEYAIKYSPDQMLLYSHRGNIKARLGDYNGAIDDYTRIIKANPEDVGALASRAQFYTQIGNHTAAIADYTTGLKIKPGDVVLLINRGVSYYRRRMMKEAVADSTAAIERQPNFMDAYFLRAISKVQLVGNGAGREDFDEAVRLGLNAKMADMWRKVFHPEGETAARP